MEMENDLIDLTTCFKEISKNFPLDGHLTVLIMNYTYEKLSNQTICQVINDYHKARVTLTHDEGKLQKILIKYGPIGYWNVSDITTLENAFEGLDDFNYNIENWDVKKM